MKYHGQLTDADGLHEPKGLHGQPAGYIYISNGANTGEWRYLLEEIKLSYIFAALDVGGNVDEEILSGEENIARPLTLDFLEVCGSGDFTYDNNAKTFIYNGTYDVRVKLSASIFIKENTTANKLKFYVQKYDSTNDLWITETYSLAPLSVIDVDNSMNFEIILLLAPNDGFRFLIEGDTATTNTFDNFLINAVGSYR